MIIRHYKNLIDMSDDEIVNEIVNDEKLCHQILIDDLFETITKEGRGASLKEICTILCLSSEAIRLVKEKAIKKLKLKMGVGIYKSKRQNNLMDIIYMKNRSVFDMQYKNYKKPTCAQLDKCTS